MRTFVRRATVLLATAATGFAVSVGPAAAEVGGLSDVTEQAWYNWDMGGGLVGQGAAQMVSAAYFGVPWSVLDFIEDLTNLTGDSPDDGLSEITQQAWYNWDIGGGMVGQGAAQMVSAAYFGVPWSVLDFIAAATDLTGNVTGDSVDLPVDLPVGTDTDVEADAEVDTDVELP